jgi:hypothetical protein
LRSIESDMFYRTNPQFFIRQNTGRYSHHPTNVYYYAHGQELSDSSSDSNAYDQTRNIQPIINAQNQQRSFHLDSSYTVTNKNVGRICTPCISAQSVSFDYHNQIHMNNFRAHRKSVTNIQVRSHQKNV